MLNSATHPPDNNGGVYECFSARNALSEWFLTWFANL